MVVSNHLTKRDYVGGSIENNKAGMVPLRGGTPITVSVGGFFPFIFVHFRKNEISL